MRLPNTDYECMTTFWEDFSIADKFGEKAIKDTFKRAFNEWKSDYKYLTELVMVLNHKIWLYFSLKENTKSNEEYEKYDKYAKLYNDLWEQADAYACDNLKGNEADYFYRTTD